MAQHQAMTAIQNEIQIMSLLHGHQGIVQMLGYGQDGEIQNTKTGQLYASQVYIAMEYIEGRELFNMQNDLNQMGQADRTEVCKTIFGEILLTVDHLHQNGIVHRDIKLENIMIDKKMNIKLADFGFATNENIDQLDTQIGSTSYMAPEIHEGK